MREGRSIDEVARMHRVPPQRVERIVIAVSRRHATRLSAAEL
jgi:hypothetical protein